MKCPKCAFENHPEARFCARCGEPLAAEPPTPPESIEVHIEGGVSGQVAIGNNILQIGNVYGGVVNVAMPEQKPRPRPRPTPVSLRPRPFPNLLDREAEVDAATAAFQSATPVEFHGQAGLGKTALLRHLAHHPSADAFPAGIVYLSARRQPVEDLLQSLFDAFYESDVPFKPTDAEVRHALRGKRALVILDDVTLARDEVEILMDTAPMCAFLLAAPERCLWGEGRATGLRGLPPDEALALVERELGRAVTPQEQAAAQSLCAALDCHPLRILQAAALAREEGLTLAEVARRVQTPSPDEALTAQVLAPLPEPEQRVLAALAALGGAPLHAEHLSALTGLGDVTPILQTLQNRGLAQAHSPRYNLTGALGQDLQTQDLTPLMERALAHFTAWAEEQQTPDRLLEEAGAALGTLEWAVEAERWKDVLRLGRAVEGALALGGRWGAWAQVLQWTLQAAQALGNRVAEAWALHQLGTRAGCLGDAAAARTSLTQALRMREALGDHAAAAVTRHNLDILLGPPAPPQEPPEPPSTPSPAPGIPMLVKGIITLASVLLLALGGLGIRHFWLRPTPTPTPTTEATVTPRPTEGTTSSPTPMTPSPTPVATLSPTPVTPSPTPVATSSPTPVTPSPTPVTPSPTPVTPSPTPITPSPTPTLPSPTPITPSPTPTPPTPTIPPDTTGPTISDITESADTIYWPPPCEPYQVTIRAFVSDSTGVSEVKLTYRVVSSVGQGDWLDLSMNQTMTAMYEATVGKEELEASLNPPSYGTPATLEYYIQALDSKDNSSTSPTGTVTVGYCIH